MQDYRLMEMMDAKRNGDYETFAKHVAYIMQLLQHRDFPMTDTNGIIELYEAIHRDTAEDTQCGFMVRRLMENQLPDLHRARQLRIDVASGKTQR